MPLKQRRRALGDSGLPYICYGQGVAFPHWFLLEGDSVSSNDLMALVGSILGSAIGLLGAIIGVSMAWRQAPTPEQRKHVLVFALLVTVLVCGFVAAMILTPGTTKSLWIVVYLPLLFLLIFWSKKKQRQFTQQRPSSTA